MRAGGGAATDEVVLAPPGVHCAACIAGVESGLLALPGIAGARVNLTLKRVRIRLDGARTVEDLIARLAALGYEALPLDMVALSATDADQTGRDLLMRLAVAFFAMMNIMLLSVAVWSGAADVTRDMFHLLSAMIALPTVAFAGQPFFRAAWARLRVGRLGMDVPISLAIILASGISLDETVHGGEKAYFDAAVMLTFFLLGGRGAMPPCDCPGTTPDRIRAGSESSDPNGSGGWSHRAQPTRPPRWREQPPGERVSMAAPTRDAPRDTPATRPCGGAGPGPCCAGQAGDAG